MFRRLLNEPLVQFLLLGGGIALAYGLAAPPATAPPDRIVLDAARIASLEAGFETLWRRPPTPAERRSLIDDFLAEEVLYREGLRLGLDENDTVVRRRLRQKVEFLLQGTLDAVAPPDDAALAAYYDANRERYREPPRYSFEQMFLGRSGSKPAGDWQAIVQRLQGGEADPASLGRPSLLPAGLTRATPAEIDRLFGKEVAARLAALDPGTWAGPVASAYGWHLIRLDEVEAPRLPPFDSVRAEVERDLSYERRQKALDALISKLEAGYDIVVDGEGAGTGP